MTSLADVYNELGFDRDPFRSYRIDSADMIRVRRAIRLAALDQQLLVVSGRRGVGKSTAVGAAMAATMEEVKELRIVKPNPVELEPLRAADLITSLILDLSDEHPKGRRELRIRQLARILGAVSAKHPILMVIEEAHWLHPATILSLKRLREISHFGRFPLFGVVLVGQRDPMTLHRGLDEVRLRSTHLEMGGLEQGEIAAAIRATVGRVFDEKAIQTASALSSVTSWIDLHNLLTNAMTRAVQSARTTILAEDVLSAESGLSPSTMTIGRKKSPVERPVARAIDSLLNQERGKQSAPATQRVA